MQILGGEFFVRQVPVKFFKRPERGLNFFGHVSYLFFFFRIFFCLLQTVFSVRLKLFPGQFRSADVPP